MEKLKKFIVNLKVAGKLKAYRVTVLTMTVFLVAVALISTLVIRSNVKNITAVWFPAIGYIQQLETLTTEYRVKQYQPSQFSQGFRPSDTDSRFPTDEPPMEN